MAEIVSFSRTPEQFTRYGERGMSHQIAAGNMTEQDAALIREFVNTMRVQSGVGDARAYKIMNSLSNCCRFIKTPLMSNTIADIHDAVLKIKNGEKIKTSIVKGHAPENLTPSEKVTITEFTNFGEPYYLIRRSVGSLSQHTKQDYVTFLRRFYLWAAEEGYCNLPAEKLRKIKPPAANKATKTAEQMLSKEEVMRMIKACTGETGIRDKAIISIMFEAGLRINEVAGLKWSDLQFAGPFVKLNVRSKTQYMRYIPLTHSREYLAGWRDAYPDGEPEGNKPVFLTTIKTVVEENGKKARRDVYRTLTYPYTRKHILTIAQRADLDKRVYPHLFRHSCATSHLQDGFPESVVKMLLWGSLSTDMLSNYAHLCNSDIDRAVAKAAGIELDDDQKEDPFKPRICPRCHSTNAPTSGFCNICGAPLTKEIAVSLEQAKEEIRRDPRYEMALDRLQQQIDALAGVLGTKS